MIAPDFTPEDALMVERFLAASKLKPVAPEENRDRQPRKGKTRIAVLDFETDPFHKGKSVRPFAWDFYDGETHTTWWNCWKENECLPALIEFLQSLDKPHLIYAHNGGKFDFTFLLKHIRGKMLIINSRIVSAHIGKHEIRDSFAALPVPLRNYKKQEFDYSKLKAKLRAQHYQQIIEYLKSDCVYLHELITAYHQEFGNVKTMASAAMKQFKRFHSYERCNENTDNVYRQFYYGGRCQCFKSGIISLPVQIYDINSQYPYVMATGLHPVTDSGIVTSHITPKTCFVDVTGHNYGAFPMRTKQGLDFTVPYGRFTITIHEWNAALETGTFKPERIHAAHNFFDRVTFAEFIDHFYTARLAAKANNDEAKKLFYKLVMNSCYGKFAQNPRNFREYEYRDYDNPPTGPEWDFELDNEVEQWRLWFRPALPRYTSWHNIMTAASITGAARALLLRAIISGKNVLYCDTDSVICEQLADVPIDENQLGAWKLESTGTRTALAGKKLYAVTSPTQPEQLKEETPAQYRKRLHAMKMRDGSWCVKFATKGSRITPQAIFAVARGVIVHYKAEAPVCKLDGSQERLPVRKIKRTAFAGAA